jgi:hypothetical protein
LPVTVRARQGVTPTISDGLYDLWMVDPRIFAEFTARTGRIICQICCDDFERVEMEPVSDDPRKVWVWDICRGCAALEKETGATY